MNLHYLAARRLHPDRTEQLRSLRRPRRERRSLRVPTLPQLGWPLGKSRLVRELLLAVPADWVVIAGQAEEGDLARPVRAAARRLSTVVSTGTSGGLTARELA